MKIEESPLRKISRFVDKKGPLAGPAKAFIDLIPHLANRKLKASSVDWEQFAPMFTSIGKPLLETRVRNAIGNPMLKCYTNCLDLLLDDLAWQRKHGTGSIDLFLWILDHFSKSHPFFAVVDRFAFTAPYSRWQSGSVPDEIERRRSSRARALAKERKRQERERKKQERARKLAKIA